MVKRLPWSLLIISGFWNARARFNQLKTIPLKKQKQLILTVQLECYQFISEALKKLSTRQKEERIATKEYHKLNLVFATEDGRPVNYSNLRENYWFRLIDKLNSEEYPLPKIKIHGMRHSCATWLYEMGVPIEVIQDILGHSVPQITKLLYVHPTVKAQDRAMSMMNDRFREAGL